MCTFVSFKDRVKGFLHEKKNNIFIYMHAIF